MEKDSRDHESCICMEVHVTNGHVIYTFETSWNMVGSPDHAKHCASCVPPVWN